MSTDIPPARQTPKFGNLDSSFDGNPYRLEVPIHSRLTQLRFCTDRWLTSIQFVTVDRNGKVTESAIAGKPFEKRDIDLGIVRVVTLAPDETIVKIEGQAFAREISLPGAWKNIQRFQHISTLILHTNNTKHEIYSEGAKGAMDFSIPLSPDSRFVGLYGTLQAPQSDSGRYINNVGILYRSFMQNPLLLETSGLFQDRNLSLKEDRLKKNDHSFLKLTVTNMSETLDAKDVVVGLVYDAQVFNDKGVTVEIDPIELKGELKIGDLATGESISAAVRVSTANSAAIQDYPIEVRLLRYSLAVAQEAVGVPEPVLTKVSVSR